ncbi:MAG: hypothetical protein IJJ85_02020 [Clostridia bacterium]|nr:hypothetical protein [Clostridia bacterium]
MASEMLNKVLETEQACDEKRKAARRQAADVINEAETRAAGMKKDAAGFAKKKAEEILAAAEKDAEDTLSEKQRETDGKIAALVASAADKKENAVKETAEYLLKLS